MSAQQRGEEEEENSELRSAHPLHPELKEFGYDTCFFEGTTSLGAPMSPDLFSQLRNFDFSFDAFPDPSPSPTSPSPSGTFLFSPSPETKAPLFSNANQDFFELTVSFNKKNPAACAFLKWLKKGKISSRKCGNLVGERSSRKCFKLDLDLLLKLCAMLEKVDAESLYFSVSTLKRNGIQRWPFDKKNKGLNTFVEGDEGAVNQNFLATNRHPGAVFEPIKVNQSAAYVPMQLETPMEQILEFSQMELPCSNELRKQLATATTVVQTSPPETSRKYKSTKIPIPLEELRQHFGKKRQEAAKSLGVSISTLKRASRQHGIREWPFKEKNKGLNTLVDGAEGANNQNFLTTDQHPGAVFQPIKVNQSASYLVDASVSMQLETPMEQIPEFSRIELPCSNALPKQLATAATVVQTSPPETVMADVRSIMTVKAKYENYWIKFDLSSAAKMEDLQKEVAKRLKLKVGSFTVKYMDEDDDWVLIGCDEDLWYCMSKSLEKLIIKMLVE